MLPNQPKTVFEDSETAMKDRQARAAERANAKTGVPLELVRAKIFGA